MESPSYELTSTTSINNTSDVQVGPAAMSSQLLAQSTDIGLQTSSNFFKSAQWSADGTCVVTNSADNKIRTFVIPPDLLAERSQPYALSEYSVITCAEPADAMILYPTYDLQAPATALVLSAINEHPIRLNSALTGDLLASYPLVNPMTEAFVKPASLCFSHDATAFIAGSNTLISTFDLSRPGEEPISAIKTGPKANSSTWTNPSIAMRGIVSALAVDLQHNVLAAGTFSRSIGLYDAGGQGECLGVFSVHGTDADTKIGGTGVTKLAWSLCGRYLYIAERNSGGIMFYDIRKSGQLLGWLEGRNAETNQRLYFDLSTREESADHDVWAGGVDGSVKRWTNPCHFEGSVLPSEGFAAHNDAVAYVGMHRSGGILATASGQRHFDERSAESQLRIWRLWP